MSDLADAISASTKTGTSQFNLTPTASANNIPLFTKAKRKSTSLRDTQRSRVYAAESSLHGRDFDSVADIQQYVDDLLASAWFQRRWGRRRITVRPGHSRRRGGADGVAIYMPIWTRYEEYVLHEVAHCLNRAGTKSHGAEFCAVLLALVDHQMGKGAARVLRLSFINHRVKHRAKGAVPPPTKPVVTKAARQQAERQKRNRAITSEDRREAAAVIRQAVKYGWFGASGRKPRAHALEIARILEGK